MNRLIAVHAPAQVVGDVIVISVELWSDEVVIHFAHVDAAIDGMPDFTLGDDAGTRYRPRSGHSGGTGTERRGMWQFVPGVPAESSRLRIALGENAVELEL